MRNKAIRLKPESRELLLTAAGRLAAYWEARCRLAVEAMTGVVRCGQCSECVKVCDEAIEAIGPLPEKQS